MKNITDVNRDIASNKNEKNYIYLIETHGYVFHPIFGNDLFRFFAIKDKQVIIDFESRIVYKCENFKVKTLGNKISDYDWKCIINFYNLKDKQINNIIGIVSICYRNFQ